MNETFWLQRARREAFRFNVGWWAQMFLPWMPASGIVASIGILALRSWDRTPLPATAAAAGVLFVGLGVSFFLARKKFLNGTEALTRLDADLSLKNRLTSAAAGVGEWPTPRANATLSLQWKWPALLWPPATAFLLAAAAQLIPLPDAAARSTRAAAEPPAWTTTQEKIDALRKDEIVQREAIEELQKSVDALRKQPNDQWFRHESLEAGDQLQSQLNQSLGDLQKNLETALGALEASRQIEESQLSALGQPLDDALDQALQGMELGKLPLDEKMLSQLKNLDPSKIRQLSTEEWKSLCERMKAGISTCSGGFCPGDKEGDALIALILSQRGGGDGSGPGTAPLALKPDETHLGTSNLETVKNDDLSHAAVGDLMGLSTGKHKVDENTWSGPQTGGTMSSIGSGGEAVWQQAATPEEQQALKRFFK
jgi:hypothetical protein